MSLNFFSHSGSAPQGAAILTFHLFYTAATQNSDFSGPWSKFSRLGREGGITPSLEPMPELSWPSYSSKGKPHACSVQTPSVGKVSLQLHSSVFITALSQALK